MAKIKIIDTGEIIDNVISIEQNMGDVTPLYNICGVHPLFGPAQCLDCKALGPSNYCGKWYVYHTLKSDAEDIILSTIEGERRLQPETQWEVLKCK